MKNRKRPVDEIDAGLPLGWAKLWLEPHPDIRPEIEPKPGAVLGCGYGLRPSACGGTAFIEAGR